MYINITTTIAVLSVLEGWFDLQPCKKEQEVQGELLLELTRTSYSGQEYLRVKVDSAR